MKIINIPSITSERCSATIKFHEKKYDVIPWNIEFECTTPTFTAKISGQLEANEVKGFIIDLIEVEKVRKGKCILADEWNFSISIQSIDSVGHFIIKVAIWSQGAAHQGEGDNMNISYEIEPSLLPILLKEFRSLYIQKK